MIEIAQAIFAAIGIACVLSTLLILSLAMTARPEPTKQAPYTQAMIDEVE